MGEFFVVEILHVSSKGTQMRGEVGTVEST
jgi:hypothetical protein